MTIEQRVLYTIPMNQTEEVVTVTEVVEENVLAAPTALDKCDRCLQSAVAVVELPGGILMACGHHWRKMAKVIKEGGYRFVVPPSEDVVFTNGFRLREMAEAGVNGAS